MGLTLFLFKISAKYTSSYSQGYAVPLSQYHVVGGKSLQLLVKTGFVCCLEVFNPQSIQSACPRSRAYVWAIIDSLCSFQLSNANIPTTFGTLFSDPSFMTFRDIPLIPPPSLVLTILINVWYRYPRSPARPLPILTVSVTSRSILK